MIWRLVIWLVYLAAAAIVVYGGYFIAFPGELGYGALIGIPLAGFGIILGCAAYVIRSEPKNWASGMRRVFVALLIAALFPGVFIYGAGFLALVVALSLLVWMVYQLLWRSRRREGKDGARSG